MTKTNARPARPDFSSGPCAKRPGWTPEALKDAAVGRSHRSKLGKKKIVEAVDRTRSMLGIPADYRIAIVPASDTGAVEMALWSLLGADSAPAIHAMLHGNYQATRLLDVPGFDTYYELRRR